MSTDPSPRARSMVLGDRVDGVPRCVHGLPRTTCVFCSRSYWTAMLIWAGVLIVCWFARGPGHPVVCADSDNLDVAPRARGGRPRYATSASPLVPRPRGRARTPPHARRRNLRLAARALRMESPSRLPHAGIRWHQGRLTLPGTVCARRCQRPRNLLCHPHTIGRRRTFHRAPVGRTVDPVAGCGRSSLPGAATALHHASTPASVGRTRAAPAAQRPVSETKVRAEMRAHRVPGAFISARTFVSLPRLRRGLLGFLSACESPNPVIRGSYAAALR